MTEEKFIAKNEAHWKKLEEYNALLARKSFKSLPEPESEVRTFAYLFQLAGFHLAYAKTHYPTGVSLPYLNRIVGVAHNYYYVRESNGLSDIKNYFARLFSEKFRDIQLYFFISLGLFFLGAIFAGLYIGADSTHAAQLLPSEYLNLNGGDSAGGVWDYSLMSAVIMTNNIRVAVTAFVMGIFAGIGSVLILIYNGIIVGALTGYVAASGGDMVSYLSLILPHGIWELTAIFLSGACGLMMGKALLMPGDLTRKDALIRSAREAAFLIPGIVVMLVLAGLIEGFFTPLPIAPVFKLLFAGLTLVGLLLYVARLPQIPVHRRRRKGFRRALDVGDAHSVQLPKDKPPLR